MFGYYHMDYVSCTLPCMLLALYIGWRVFAIESNLCCTIGIRIYRYTHIVGCHCFMPSWREEISILCFVRSVWAAWRAVKECTSKVYQNIEHAAAVVTAVYIGLWPASKNFCIRKFLSPHSSTVYVWILPRGLRKLYSLATLWAAHMLLALYIGWRVFVIESNLTAVATPSCWFWYQCQCHTFSNHVCSTLIN